MIQHDPQLAKARIEPMIPNGQQTATGDNARVVRLGLGTLDGKNVDHNVMLSRL